VFPWIFSARPDGFNGHDEQVKQLVQKFHDIATFEQKNYRVLHFGEGLGDVDPVYALVLLAIPGDDALGRVSHGSGENHG